MLPPDMRRPQVREPGATAERVAHQRPSHGTADPATDLGVDRAAAERAVAEAWHRYRWRAFAGGPPSPPTFRDREIAAVAVASLAGLALESLAIVHPWGGGWDEDPPWCEFCWADDGDARCTRCGRSSGAAQCICPTGPTLGPCARELRP